MLYTNPELFSSAFLLSAAVGSLFLDDAKATIHKFFPVASDEKVESKQYNLLPLLDQLATEQKKTVRWYIDCGDDDFL